MKKHIVCAVGMLAMAIAHGPRDAAAQATVPELYLAPEMSTKRAGLSSDWKPDLLTVLPDGRMVGRTRNSADVAVFAPDGAPLKWDVAVGWRGESDVAYIGRMGWSGTTAWLFDGWGKQAVAVDKNGKVTRSIPYPSWVHPRWADRHTYPIFGRMDAYAVYENGDLLVEAAQPRTLFDTPSYNRKLTHLLRITSEGAIIRDVARFDEDKGRFNVARGKFSSGFLTPFFAPLLSAVSGDGSRVTLVTPGVSPTDSGSFRVAAIGEKGDTLFSRRYDMPLVRLSQASIDSALAKATMNVGEHADSIRRRMATRVPRFKSFVTALMVGTDHSSWIIQRPLSDTAQTRIALVIDDRGEPLARVTIPPTLIPLAVDRGHLWAHERAKPIIVRYRLQATPVPVTSAPPPRTSKASKGTS